VVLVPGVHGSVFRTKLTDAFSAPHPTCRGPRDWRKPSPFNLLHPVFKDCQTAQLNITFDGERQRWSNVLGVQLDWSVDFGGVRGLSAQDPNAKQVTSWFQKMMDAFRRSGYSPGVDLHGAPYDWRMAPDGWSQPGDFYEQLRALLERTVAANGGPAHLVTHSLGGMAILGFLASVPQAWKFKHVASFVPIVPSFAGSVSNLLTFAYGFDPAIPIPHDYLRPLYNMLPSGALQLPTPAAYDGGPPLVMTAGRNYTARDVAALLDDLGLKQQGFALRRLTDMRLRGDLLPHPGVPVLLLTCSGIPTPRTIIFKGTLTADHQPEPPKVVYGDGDGVVNRESFLWARDAWSAEHIDFPKVDHYSVLWHRRAVEAVKRHVFNFAGNVEGAK